MVVGHREAPTGIGMLLELPADGELKEVTIGPDSQAAILATQLHRPSSACYLVDLIHERAKEAEARHVGLTITLQWVPGHVDIPQNESADRRAKEAARGNIPVADSNFLPDRILQTGPLPISKSAKRTQHGHWLKEVAARELSLSPRFRRMAEVDRSTPSDKFQTLVKGVTRKQAAVLYQLRCGHIPLNYHLHRIGKAASPACEKCGHRSETVLHFLLQCPAHKQARDTLYKQVGYHARSLSQLLTNRSYLAHLFRYITSTKRLEATFGDLNRSPAPSTNNADPA